MRGEACGGFPFYHIVEESKERDLIERRIFLAEMVDELSSIIFTAAQGDYDNEVI